MPTVCAMLMAELRTFIAPTPLGNNALIIVTKSMAMIDWSRWCKTAGPGTPLAQHPCLCSSFTPAVFLGFSAPVTESVRSQIILSDVEKEPTLGT